MNKRKPTRPDWSNNDSKKRSFFNERSISRWLLSVGNYYFSLIFNKRTSDKSWIGLWIKIAQSQSEIANIYQVSEETKTSVWFISTGLRAILLNENWYKARTKRSVFHFYQHDSRHLMKVISFVWVDEWLESTSFEVNTANLVFSWFYNNSLSALIRGTLYQTEVKLIHPPHGKNYLIHRK